MREKNSNLHISDEKIKKLAMHGLEEEADLISLEHITNCNECAIAYANYIENNLITVPANFKDEVMVKAERLNLTFLKNRLKFYGYCFRVGLACACSILLLLTLDMDKITSIDAIISKNQVVTDSIQDRIESLNDYINNWEVKFNEKEKE